jgi:hypothetical protein
MRRFLKFIKLEIDTPTEEIDSLVFPPLKFSPPSKSPRRFITTLELRNICHTTNVKKHNLGNDRLSIRDWRSGSLKYPFKFPFDVWFPSGVELSPSPFSELYPIPTPEEDLSSAYDNKYSTSEIFDLQLRER